MLPVHVVLRKQASRTRKYETSMLLRAGVDAGASEPKGCSPVKIVEGEVGVSPKTANMLKEKRTRKKGYVVAVKKEKRVIDNAKVVAHQK